ncbi:hypothetical protein VF21_06236 [Pseudogymnoascus sp. 05NY08]|nr:hypothetical protein VF21_06236 [Pseudogymnoascus sp. 05NY08]
MAELAGTAVGAIPIGIQVCQGLVEYYGSWKDAPKDVARMFQSIQSLEETLNAVNAVFKNNGVASQAEFGVQSGIDSRITSITELQSQLIKVQEVNGHSIWSKLGQEKLSLRIISFQVALIALTVARSSIVNKLQIQQSSRDVGLAFAYCNYKEHDMQTLANLIGSLVQQLVQCYELPTSLRLLCTSRHLGDIREAFADASHLEIRAIDADVALYVETQILQVPKLVKFCKKAGDLQGTIVEKLVMKAKGMFLLAELHLESLKTKTDIKSLRKALDVLPDKLEKTYDDSLERIQRQPEDESKLAMRVLSWITHAVRPLKVEEIQHAIAVMNFDPDDTTLGEEGLPDEAELITVCGGSAVIDQDSGVIRLVHYTTQDYFERHRSKIFPTAQADILCACIRYLSLDSFKNSPCETNSDLRKRQARFRLLGYASCNWANHVCGELDDTVQERAIQFLNNKSLLSNATLVRLLDFPENISTLSSSIQTWWVSAHLHSVFWSDMLRTEIPGITIAAEFGLTSLIDKMLKQGNSINESGIQGRAALHEAARNGHEATVELLLERGANTEAKDLTMALLWAAESGLEAIVQLLVEHGADMEATSLYGYTPLLFAGSKGYVSMVRLLLQNGANIEVTDKYGNPLLFVAARNGNKAVVRLLLEKWFAIKDQGRDAVL